MYRIDIYLESDTWYMGKRKRKAGYFITYTLKNGQDYDVLKVLTAEGTYNHCLLVALNAALARVTKPCEIHIHSANLYILDAMEKHLPVWEENEFRNRKGDPVKDRDQWKQIGSAIKGHMIVAEPGLHEYSKWMKWMFMHDEDGAVDNLVEKPEKPHKQ